jgi:hypothetical protein
MYLKAICEIKNLLKHCRQSEFNFLSMSDNAHNLWLGKRHLVTVAAAAVAAFYLHCLSVIMASSQPITSTTIGSTSPPMAPSQQWTDAEMEIILLHFINHKSEIGDTGNFKKRTYGAAAGDIPGQTKSALQVQNKWQSVSY